MIDLKDLKVAWTCPKCQSMEESTLARGLTIQNVRDSTALYNFFTTSFRLVCGNCLDVHNVEVSRFKN